ncbi:response regulator transcription factor [Streptomyces olivaceoviridis]
MRRTSWIASTTPLRTNEPRTPLRRNGVLRWAIGPAERAEENALTPRETTVLPLTDALTVDAIGRRLDTSVRTVHQHVKNIYRKLGTRDRVGRAASYAFLAERTLVVA